jgi:hypothetical protein
MGAASASWAGGFTQEEVGGPSRNGTALVAAVRGNKTRRDIITLCELPEHAWNDAAKGKDRCRAVFHANHFNHLSLTATALDPLADPSRHNMGLPGPRDERPIGVAISASTRLIRR